MSSSVGLDVLIFFFLLLFEKKKKNWIIRCRTMMKFTVLEIERLFFTRDVDLDHSHHFRWNCITKEFHFCASSGFFLPILPIVLYCIIWISSCPFWLFAVRRAIKKTNKKTKKHFPSFRKRKTDVQRDLEKLQQQSTWSYKVRCTWNFRLYLAKNYTDNNNKNNKIAWITFCQ
jgi:hypothetical protein